MNKAKLIIWLLVLGFMGLVIFQNDGHFLNAQQSLRLNLGVLPEYHSPNLPMVFFYLVFFLYGLLVAYGFGLLESLRNTRLQLRNGLRQNPGFAMLFDMAFVDKMSHNLRHE